MPFNIRPDLELSLSNLICLCRECHFVFGHLKSWTSYNESVRIDVASYRKKVDRRP